MSYIQYEGFDIQLIIEIQRDKMFKTHLSPVKFPSLTVPNGPVYFGLKGLHGLGGIFRFDRTLLM